MDGITAKNLKVGGKYWMDSSLRGRVQVTLVRLLEKTEADECRWRFNGTHDCIIREDGWHSFLSRSSALSESR